MTDRDRFLAEFHAAQPGVTARAFGRGTSYARLAAAVAGAATILEVGCGDGHLLRLLGARAVGVDPSAAELAHAPRDRILRARAQALPFADRSFDAVISHLVLDVCGDAEHVVREMVRVTRTRGIIAAVVGGGPAFDAPPTDAFAAYLRHAPPPAVRLGDPRVRDIRTWQRWLPTATVERIAVDLSGPFADVWATLASGYELHGVDTTRIRAALAAELGPTPSLTVVMFLVVARL